MPHTVRPVRSDEGLDMIVAIGQQMNTPVRPLGLASMARSISSFRGSAFTVPPTLSFMRCAVPTHKFK
jgi:hypothetical protein